MKADIGLIFFFNDIFSLRPTWLCGFGIGRDAGYGARKANKYFHIILHKKIQKLLFLTRFSWKYILEYDVYDNKGK